MNFARLFSGPEVCIGNRSEDRRWRKSCALLFGFALTVRCLHLWQIQPAPFYTMELGDSLSYSNWAKQIAAGEWLGETVFYQSPLYPYLLGFIYLVFGTGKTAVLLVQCLAGSIACVMLADAGRRLGSGSVGLLSGLILACYAPAIFFDGLIQKSSLDTVLICLIILGFARWQQRPFTRTALQLGIGLGLLILNRENALILLPALAMAMRSARLREGRMPVESEIEDARCGSPGRAEAHSSPDMESSNADDTPASQQAPVASADALVWALGKASSLADRGLQAWQLWGRQVAVLCLGTAVVLFPVAFRNAVVGGSFHLTTSQFGPNFFIGNNANANGMYQPIRIGGGSAAYERDDAVELAEQATGYPLTAAQVSGYWTQQALDDIRSQPLDWVRLMVRKLVLLVNAVEITDTEDLQTYAEWSWPLWLFSRVFHLGVLLPLAVAGFLLSRAVDIRLRFLVLMVIAYALSVWVFYVMGRYRFPIAVMLILPAAAGLQQIMAMLRGAFPESVPVYRRAAVVLAATITAVACNWPLLDRDAMSSITHYNMAVQFDRANDLTAAEAEYRRVVQLNPADADAYQNLGDVLQRQGELSAATEALLAALQLDPSRPLVHFELASLYVRQNETDSAIRHYQRTTELVPDFPAAYLNLGVLLHSKQQYEQALPMLLRAVQLVPDYERAVMALVEELLTAQRQPEAIHYLTVLSRNFPQNRTFSDRLQQLELQIQQKVN